MSRPQPKGQYHSPGAHITTQRPMKGLFGILCMSRRQGISHSAASWAFVGSIDIDRPSGGLRSARLNYAIRVPRLIWLQGIGTECIVCSIKPATINKRCGVCRKGAALRLRNGSSFLGLLHFRAASASHHRALYRVDTGVRLQSCTDALSHWIWVVNLISSFPTRVGESARYEHKPRHVSPPATAPPNFIPSVLCRSSK